MIPVSHRFPYVAVEDLPLFTLTDGPEHEPLSEETVPPGRVIYFTEEHVAANDIRGFAEGLGYVLIRAENTHILQRAKKR